MPQQNLFELILTEAEIVEVETALATLDRVLGPKLKTLTADVRMEIPKMGDKTVSFVTKSREYAGKNNDLVPVFLDMAMLDADVSGFDRLRNYLQRLVPLTRAIEDSMMLAGSEAYQGALIFYRAVKMAAQAGIPNADIIYKDLSARFPGGGGKRTAASKAPITPPVDA